MTTTMLKVRGLTSGYGQAPVLNAVDLDIASGQIFALLGKNGMGKSTLLKTIMGFLPKMNGRVEFNGQDVSGAPPHRLARTGVGYVAQEQALFQDLTVEENIRLSVRGRQIAEAFSDVGRSFPILLQRLGQRAGTLSGGEQKMLLVARSLANGAQLLLIDEISEGLQPSMVDHVASVLTDLKARKNTTMLLVEQNIRFATQVASGYAVLERGAIVARGDAGDQTASERIACHMSV